MGQHINISATLFPEQGELLGKQVRVAFHHETQNYFLAKCIRDDIEEPFRTIFQLEDGRIILSTECQYS